MAHIHTYMKLTTTIQGDKYAIFISLLDKYAPSLALTICFVAEIPQIVEMLKKLKKKKMAVK